MLVGAVALDPADGDGSLAIGVDGRTLSHGDVHFRVTFRATALAQDALLHLDFGTGSASGSGPDSEWGVGLVGASGSSYAFRDAFYDVTVLAIPEPGTALAPGFGLALLAIRSPRRRPNDDSVIVSTRAGLGRFTARDAPRRTSP